ncbi:hypothetical protein ACEQPO_24880 [Bacillus sp. SL00103]
MNQLTLTLKRMKKTEEKFKTTREEWIAGLSHDLKNTPLVPSMAAGSCLNLININGPRKKSHGNGTGDS